MKPQSKKKHAKLHERKAAREKPFEQKESYRWVEALMAVEKQFQAVEKLSQPTEQQLQQASELISPPRIIHIFDREGDIAEVFDHIRQMERTGVIVRAAHDRSLDPDNAHLWEYVSAQPIQFYQQVNLPETVKRKARTANLVIRFYPVQLRLPSRLKNSEPLNVYAVYAVEISPPEGEEAVEWMLLTTERVTNEEQATTILRWYSYRWRVEEYHKILKSGCKAESYRLSATSMEALLGFLTVIAAELLRITYMHRTQPDSLATTVISKVQLDVLKASASKLPKVLTVAWVIEEIARLGGFLSHRRKTPIGIQVLWSLRLVPAF